MSNLTADGITNWDEERWMEFRNWLRSLLHNHPVEITFIKTDGTERVMNCSLESKYIDSWSQAKFERQLKQLTESATDSKDTNIVPVDFESLIHVEDKHKKSDPMILKVFDVDKQQWRSFKLQKITNIYQLLIKYGDSL